MINDLISVIIPVYNVEKYLEECINSVIDQTYKRIEVIIVDDGSTDKSLEIIEMYKEQYPNIKVISQENSGQSVARNKGIEVATGKYIYFLDSDDYIAHDTLETLMKVITDSEVDLVRFSADTFLDDIHVEIDKKKYNFNDSFEENKIYEKREFLSTTINAFASSPVLYIVKRSMLMDNNIKFVPNIIHEDDLFTVKLFLSTNRAMYVSKSFYKRRYREGSTMTNKSIHHKEKSFKSRCIILGELNSLLKIHSNKNELDLINTRIKNTIQILERGYPELNHKYKINEIKKLKLPSIFFRYYYQYIRRIIATKVRKKKK